MTESRSTFAPRFSVVVPVFNRAATVGPTIDSVLSQSFADFELIIVDDGSDDGDELRACLQAFADERIRYVWRPNGGGGAARNTGILAAKGTYIAFLDSDDQFLPHKLERCACLLTGNEMQAVYSYMNVDRGVGRYWIRPSRAIQPDEDMGEYLFVANQFIQTSTIVLHRAAASRVLFDPTLRKGQDLDFCIRLHAHGVRFTMIEQPLTIWHDVTEAGRTSRVEGHVVPTAWLQKIEPLLTRDAALGYRATVLAYYLAESQPVEALKDILVGYIRAGVPLRVTLRQIMRCFLPRDVYRQVVNTFVKLAQLKLR